MKHTQNNNTRMQNSDGIHRITRNYKPDIERATERKRSLPKQTAGNSNYDRRINGKASERKRPASARRSLNGGNMPRRRKRKLTFFEALGEELAERGIKIGIPITAEQLIRGVISGVLIILFAMLQTTFFDEFKPFGAVPDLMFALTVAIAFTEGEKWGSVCGLISAVVIDSLGGVGFTVLPLLYTVTGYICGVLVRDFFSNTSLPRVAVIFLFTFLRSAVTVITAAVILDATLLEILANIVIPEYFSTVLMSALIYLVTWLAYMPFHKTRAERTS